MYLQSRIYAMHLGIKKNFVYVNGYDHPHILAGQGTMGLEICEQVPDMDAVVIPVGGGGLIAGSALAIKSLYPHVKIIVSACIGNNYVPFSLTMMTHLYLWS